MLKIYFEGYTLTLSRFLARKWISLIVLRGISTRTPSQSEKVMDGKNKIMNRKGVKSEKRTSYLY